jgi:hypothetical protein
MKIAPSKPDPDAGKQVRDIKLRPCHRCETQTRYIIQNRRVCVICQINDHEADQASQPFIPSTRAVFAAEEEQEMLSPYTPAAAR